MISEWGTMSGDSWKQRVCVLKDLGTLKTKIYIYIFVLFFPLFSLRFIEINYTIIC